MKFKQIFLYSGLTVALVLLLTIIWEFSLENPIVNLLGTTDSRGPESATERWMDVAVTLVLVTVALVIPVSISIRSSSAGARVGQALGESEKHLSHIMDSVVDGMIIIDENGTIELVNPAVTKLFGYRKRDLIGQNVRTLMPEPYRSEHDGYLSNYLKSGEAKIIGFGREMEGVREDGTVFPMDLAVSESRIDGRRMFTGVVRDITSRIAAADALKQSEERYALALEGTNDVLWDWDIVKDRVYYSDRMRQIFGLDPSNIRDSGDWRDYVLAEDWPGFITALTDHLKGQTEFFEAEYRIADARGNTRWLHHRGSAVRDKQGHAYRMAGSISDISSSRVAQGELLLAKDGAESANAAKSLFLSRMSHELRTPLNAILGFGQLMIHNPKESLSERQTESVHYILESGEHLLKLINEILDLAKIEARSISIDTESISIDEIIEECVVQLQFIAEKRAIEITRSPATERKILVSADPTRLSQVIINLLSNAIKYAPDESDVEIDCAETDDGNLRIYITDSGTGLTPEQQEEIFLPFNRLDLDESEVEGTGIGLTISRQLMELMDGAIGCESELGHGSTFWIEIPLDRAQPVVVASKANPKSENKSAASERNGCRTLVYVEDNPANTKLMEEIIGRVPNLEMLAAGDAEHGLELVAENDPDIVVMDINLPGINGFEALRRLRNNADTKDIPVIALSASALPEDVQKGLDAGFFEYLTKPVNVVEVLATIADALDVT